MPKNLVAWLLLACSFWQCSQLTETGAAIGQDYYPVKVGNYWIYEVSQTTFTNQFLHEPGDSLTFQVRERVDTVFSNQAGELTYKLIRSRRISARQAWGSDSVITINRSFSDLRYSQDNQKWVKLIFPVAENKKWDGNAFNNRGAEEYYYTQVARPFRLGDTTYTNTVRVLQLLVENQVERRERQEVYALGVGLIFKKTVNIDFCNGGSGQNCRIGQGYVIHGRRTLQKLIAYGH